MAFHGTPRYSMEFHGIPWNSITTSWNSAEPHGIPWNSMDTPWNSMAFHETPWILHGYSMGVSWNSMDVHRFPWNSMEVFHTGPLHISIPRVKLQKKSRDLLWLLAELRCLEPHPLEDWLEFRQVLYLSMF